MFNISPSVADALYNWSSILLIAGTLGTIFMGAAKERFSNERIAENEAYAARANERAAELEKEAAEARLEQEKLRAQLAWRILSSKSASDLASLLTADPQSVMIRYVANDPEAHHLAIQFANAFVKAKWKIGLQSVPYVDRVLLGIFIPDEGGKGTEFLRNAFSKTEIPFSSEKLPAPGMMFGSENKPTDAILLIGSKAPPDIK